MLTLRPSQGPQDALYDVMSVVYDNGAPVPTDNVEETDRARFAGIVDGETVGTFSIYDFDVAFGDATVRCAGIGAVGVLPHRRGGGVGQQLMEECVRECARQGFAVTSLYPFSDRFYAKSGYATTGWRLMVEATTALIPSFKEELPVRVVGPDAWPEIVPCQTAFAHRHPGAAVRDAKLWRRVLGENRPLKTYLFGSGGAVEAWVVVAHKVDFWTLDHVSDLGWSTPAGYRSALAFLRRLGINKTGLTWYEPMDGPFLGAHFDHGATAKIDRSVMFRALAPLPVRGDGEAVVLQIEDPLVPALHGTWRISREGWERTSDAAEVVAEVGPATQGLLGMPSFSALLRDGRIEEIAPGAVARLELLYPPATVYHPDFY